MPVSKNGLPSSCFNETGTSTETYTGCEGDGYEVIVNGTVYNEGNPTGTEMIPNGTVLGTDSIIIINLTFNPTSTGTEVYTGCESDGYEVIVNGTTYNESNPTGTETLTNANGCDSIVTIDLTFNPATTGTEVYTGQEGSGYEVIVNGTVYNESNPLNDHKVNMSNVTQTVNKIRNKTIKCYG